MVKVVKKECNPNSSKAKDKEYLCNPETGRWVKCTGVCARKLFATYGEDVIRGFSAEMQRKAGAKPTTALTDQEILDKWERLFKELVPSSGSAETSSGELVRAISKIRYRFFNDGDMPITTYDEYSYLWKNLSPEDKAFLFNNLPQYLPDDDAEAEKMLNKFIIEAFQEIKSRPEVIRVLS